MRSATRKKRDYVAEVALRLFIERGYENVTVDDIIRETHTSKGTFYHYFKGKDEIIHTLSERQKSIIEAWKQIPPAQVISVEEHVSRLLLNMAESCQGYQRLIRSLSALSMQNDVIFGKTRSLYESLITGIQIWLPDLRKAEMLTALYFGTITDWCYREQADLTAMMSRNLAHAWSGLRFTGPSDPLPLSATDRIPRTRVAIIGGGLAGITAAAYLSELPMVEGVLFERSPQLGGRAFTYEKSGFTLNYGAHAIYGIDRHTVSRLEDELGLSFSSKQVDKRKIVYAKHGLLTPAPLDFANLVRTDLLSPLQKVRFVGEITAMIAQIHTLKNYPTLGDYLAESDADEDLKELWEHLVCSNFFISPEDARKVPGPVISEYYHNLFRSGKPVNYVLGSWAVLTNQLRQKIEVSGRWAIALQESVDEIRYENGKYVLKSKKREEAFDKVVFAMPVQQVARLCKGTAWEPFLKPYETNTPTEVMVFDVGLREVVARPFNYISDMDNKMFITDVSTTDHTLVPEGGQLLQGIAYLNDAFTDEEERKAYLDRKMEQMEAMFDRYYPGWREAAEVKRVSKRAMVASVKNIAANRLLPNRLENVPFYFCGDGCVGKGELAERAFSSARRVANRIAAEVRETANQQALPV